ncbi:ATP-dependent metallopeptidase FtsH/Yme1/Tma family protein [Propionibacterium freudenreichii]|uniref:ATP-dependent zinc metalloprotease FtsH n=1 Tax=Propionibacterium freudenreichii TaxID=1744 RepID=UPI0021A6FA09|nr:ATP-dependent zinc metalloprotease FtsH [Propionibacterium freudenreichii]MCT3013261.1 ATP-dependent metallopeptidase FtsH/Yme1/Tma family protein [Propionibacterium freudenreichii]MDK9611660.1 ATP-dependent metallopeptidase FtsH/Yme1/Tma family protein [Propionibacterium freudenreichii]MDK9620180.1 ATP-dependent zinc metalloprotease FtsH [Propionibacterium freudenreichii]MDK9622411.1 ATP-dependent metallopeptidase FtsH/Yme1/Tma family protein [Propionibacterium freudenreichii]
MARRPAHTDDVPDQDTNREQDAPKNWRSEAPQGPPPLDSPKPWHTEGLPKKPSDGDRPKRPLWMRFVPWLILLLLFFIGINWFNAVQAPPTISYNEFITQVKADNVQSVHAKGDSIDGVLKKAAIAPDTSETKKGESYTKFTTERPTWANDDLLTELNQHSVTVSAVSLVNQTSPWVSLLVAFVPWILIIGVYVWFMNRMSKGGGMGGLGLKRDVKPVEKDTVRVNFSDVAGIDEVEDEVRQIVDFLRNPDKYRKVGARAPKGVLLEGEPGTGKTLLARATAGEAEVPFFSASASEFIEMIVGVGAQRVRQLFEEARKAAPAIIFIDEIDAIGRSRASNRSLGGNDEREQTLNQILTEMDGFDGTEGVVVMAATNRADVLDPALTRPGRFDRVITVSPPDQKGRAAILRVHTREIPTAKDVNLDQLAASTPGMTGADLANLANEAALQAASRNDTQVYQRDFTNALEQIQLGVARSVVIPDDERRRTAYHESGHALLGMLQKGADPVRKVSIIPRGQALGVTLSTPDTDKYGYDEQYLLGRIVGALGGMAAENAIFSVVTTGAESDLKQATAIARQMVGKWGMSEKVGPVMVLPDDADPRQIGISDETLSTVDGEVRRIIGECQDKAVRLLKEHRAQLDSIATKLLEKETLDENEVYAAAGIDRPRDDSNLSGAEASPAAPAPPPDTPPDDSGTAAPAGPTPPSSLWGPPQGSPSS